MRDCLRLPLLLISCLYIAACTSLSITQPIENSKPATPVRVDVSANADIEPGSVKASLDGTDVSNLFSISGNTATASLPSSVGAHALDLSANVWDWLWRTYDPKTAKTVHFEATPPLPGGSIHLDLATPVVSIEPSHTEQLPVAIQRYGAFSGQVDITTTLGQTIIYGNTYYASLPLTAPSGSRVGETNANVTAIGSLNGGFVRDDQQLKIRIAHRPGVFAAGSVAVKRDLQSVVGPDGITTLIAQNGPPGARRYQAQFRKQAATVGSPIDFDPGTPDFGGGGFCPAGPGGFVISGGSTAAAHQVTIMLFDDPLAAQAFSIPATAAGSTTVVEPKLQFSTNCDVVVMIGADTDPATRLAFRANAYDLILRKRVCSVASNSPMFQAQLLAPANGNQLLRITTSGPPTDCPIF